MSIESPERPILQKSEQESSETWLEKLPHDSEVFIAKLKDQMRGVSAKVDSFKHNFPIKPIKPEYPESGGVQNSLPDSLPAEYFEKYKSWVEYMEAMQSLFSEFVGLANRIGFTGQRKVQHHRFIGSKKEVSPHTGQEYLKVTHEFREPLQGPWFEETIELAMLIRDEPFMTDFRDILLSLKSIDPNYENFKQLESALSALPGNDRESLKRWMLQPIRRMCHSLFTHTTSLKALDNIANQGLRSSDAVPTARETGALAAQLGENAIYFSINNVSLYGKDQDSKGTVLLLTRGDQLLKQGVIPEESALFQRQPFTTWHDHAGIAVVDQFHPKMSTQIPAESFIVEGDAKDPRFKKFIENSKPFAGSIDGNLGREYTAEKTKTNAAIANLSKVAMKFFGEPSIPNVAVSILRQSYTHKRIKFPQLIEID